LQTAILKQDNDNALIMCVERTLERNVNWSWRAGQTQSTVKQVARGGLLGFLDCCVTASNRCHSRHTTSPEPPTFTSVEATFALKRTANCSQVPVRQTGWPVTPLSARDILNELACKSRGPQSVALSSLNAPETSLTSKPAKCTARNSWSFSPLIFFAC
jgi:hypothetical protein